MRDRLHSNYKYMYVRQVMIFVVFVGGVLL